MKTFTVAGHSKLNGVVKLRFASDLVDRIKVLQRNGHTDIELQELPHAMTKDEIRAFFGEEAKPAKAKKAAPVIEAAAVIETAEEEAEDTVKWLEEGEEPAKDPEAITYKTFEEALAAVPKRTEKGTRIKQEVREALARDMMAA